MKHERLTTFTLSTLLALAFALAAAGFMGHIKTTMTHHTNHRQATLDSVLGDNQQAAP
jgi:hypothetical protein